MRAANRSPIGNEIEFEQRKLDFLNSKEISVAVKIEVIRSADDNERIRHHASVDIDPINLYAVIVIVCTHRIFGHESSKIIVFALLRCTSAAGLTNYSNFHKTTILSLE
nr:MAG TPA: hypothetical protein [Inoviridae sp.]